MQPKEFKDYGVIVDGGSKVYMKGFTHYEVDKITDEQFEDIANDYDDIEAPPGPYKVQPENQGVCILCMIFLIHRNNKNDDACKI